MASLASEVRIQELNIVRQTIEIRMRAFNDPLERLQGLSKNGAGFVNLQCLSVCSPTSLAQKAALFPGVIAFVPPACEQTSLPRTHRIHIRVLGPKKKQYLQHENRCNIKFFLTKSRSIVKPSRIPLQPSASGRPATKARSGKYWLEKAFPQGS